MPTLNWTALQHDLQSEDGDRFLAALEQIQALATVEDLPTIYALVRGDDYSVRTTLAPVIAQLDTIHALPTLLQVMLQNEREGWDNDGIDVTTGDLITTHPQAARLLLEKMRKSEQADERALAQWGLEYVVQAENTPPLAPATHTPQSAKVVSITTPPPATPKGCLSQWFVNLLVIFGVVAGLAQWGWVAPLNKAQQDCTAGQHAAWLSVDWTSQPLDADAVATLAHDVQQNQFRYIFPFTTYLKADGTFNPTYTYAPEFVAAVRQTNSSVKVLAWVGLPLENDKPIGIQGSVSLDNADQRATIISFLSALVESDSFDGVHVDAETVWNNNADFLTFLEELRVALPPEALLSISGSHWMPQALAALPLRWSDSYYRAVAERVDQIAVMSYDSYAPHSALYRTWLHEQTIGISRSIEGTNTELLMGVSVAKETTASHNPTTETLADGIAGICASADDVAPADGIALYAAWDTTTAEQTTWRQWVE